MKILKLSLSLILISCCNPPGDFCDTYQKVPDMTEEEKASLRKEIKYPIAFNKTKYKECP